MRHTNPSHPRLERRRAGISARQQKRRIRKERRHYKNVSKIVGKALKKG